MKHRLRRKFLYILLLFINKIILLLPLNFSLVIGKLGGFLAYLFLPKYSKLAKDNLRMAYKDEKLHHQLNKITRNVFANLGMSAAEVLSMPKIKRQLDKKMYGVGFEKIDKALSKGKGVIMIGAHFGNWEILPAYFTAKGYPLSVIARRVYYEKYDELVKLLRDSTGVNIIFRDESPRRVLEVLKNNGLLGIMPDQDIDSIEGVFVRFFNKPAYTAIAPVSLAMRMGSPMLPCFIMRDGARHKIVVEDPLNLIISGNKQEDIVKNTQLWSNVVESYIRKYPEQWVWMHRRWKTKPGKNAP
ncbi:MAG: lysophospholipid acyltransferase family protein [Candidatus Omnitrophota bacterium]|nr:MAG: lysophospholipid acyltransferase family protein [Candidatus Omnitrophota bacterium]